MKLSHTKSQKGRDAKFHVLTPKSRNVVLRKIKKTGNKARRREFDVRFYDYHYA
jgi:DUF971 family protein